MLTITPAACCHKWFEMPRLFGLAFDPLLGPLFLKEQGKIDWELERFDEQQGVDNAIAERAKALFTEVWHANYRSGLAAKHEAVYKDADFKEEYDPVKGLVEFWQKHDLGRLKDDWLRLLGRKASNEKAKTEVPHFWRTNVKDELLFDWAVDHFMIKSHNNNGVEGLFNLVEIYGNPQLDNLKLELLVQFAKNVLYKERAERRQPEYRMRRGPPGGENYNKPLEKHLRNSKQKTRSAEQSVEWSAPHTLERLKEAEVRGRKREKKRREEMFRAHIQDSQRRTKKARVDENTEYEIEAIVAHKKVGDRMQYKIRWEHYDEEWDEWKDQDELAGGEAHDAYVARVPEAAPTTTDTPATPPAQPSMRARRR